MSKENPFEDLDKEWMEALESMSDEQLNSKLAELTKAEEQNLKNKKEDQDLAEKKESVKQASEQYRDHTKGYKLRVKFIVALFEARGKI
jgi:hypothetical protein